MTRYVIRLVEAANGQPTEFDGQYVAAYDPDYHDPVTGYDGGVLVVTPDPLRALKFFTSSHAMETWKQTVSCPCHRTRPDGKPNRPLTAFTCCIETSDFV